MFSALMARHEAERDWQALLAGEISMLIACLGGAKSPRFEDYVITRKRSQDLSLEQW
jgi:hypothetical protein